MAKIKIQGHASGTGVLTVTAPNTSTDRTITLPDGTGTLIADDGSGNVDVTGTVTCDDTLNIENGSGYGAIEVGGSSGARLDMKTPFSDDYDMRLITDGTYHDIYGGTNGIIRVFNNGSERMRVDSSGNVGIGVTPDDAKLQVSGNVFVGSAASNATIDDNLTTGGLDVAVGNGTKAFQVWDDSSTATPRFIVERTGNVGIGVTPESWDNQFTVLNVGVGGVLAGGTDGDYFASGANWYQTGGADKYVTSSKLASLYTQNNGTHTFQVAPSGTADSAISWTTAMTIDNSGFILMGAAGNTYNIASGKGIKIDGNSGMVNIARENECPLFVNRTGNGGNVIDIRDSGTQVGTITVNGSAASYNTTSDYRLKENVVPMTGSIDRLKELNPSRFNFITDADTTVDGFLAHEVSDTVPEAISGTKDAMRTEEYEVEPAIEATYDEEGNELTPAVEAVMGEREVEDYQGIDQGKLVPLLTSALQEAVAKIEELTTRIEILEAN